MIGDALHEILRDILRTELRVVIREELPTALNQARSSDGATTPGRYLSTQEVSARTGRPVTTVRERFRSGQWPGIRDGRTWVLEESRLPECFKAPASTTADPKELAGRIFQMHQRGASTGGRR